MNYAEAIGIDLGTTFSVVSVYDLDSGEAVVLKDEEGRAIIPSVIQYKEGQFIIGHEAKAAFDRGEDNCASVFKRVMGKSDASYHMGGDVYTGEQLSAMLLRYLREFAEKQLNRPVTEAIVTVPAYFQNDELTATEKAAHTAGFQKIIRLLHEPTAAAIAYCSRDWSVGDNLMIYDLGGGTFDVTLCRMDPGYSLKVLASSGDTGLGGKDWDEMLNNLVMDKLRATYFLDLDAPEMAQSASQLGGLTEQLKKNLSAMKTATYTLMQGSNQWPVEVTRDEFEAITRPLLERTGERMDAVMDSAKLRWKDISRILLVGGSTRMPMVREYIQQKTGVAPRRNLNPDEVVAIGAAVDTQLNHNPGVLTAVDESNAPRRNGGLLIDITVADATAHALGTIAVDANQNKYINDVVIPINTQIPAKCAIAQEYYTSASEPNEWDIYIVQGESKNLDDCRVIGHYSATGIRHVSTGPAIVEVMYGYNESGIAEVKARQRDCGNLEVRKVPVPADMSWMSMPPKKEMRKEDRVIMMSVDVSGSMYTEEYGVTRINSAKAAMRNFVSKFDMHHTKIGIMATADRVEILLQPTDNVTSIINAISRVESAKVGGGSSAQPFDLAEPVLDRCGGRRSLIILTDGEWFGDAPQKSRSGSERYKRKGYEVCAIGIGDAKFAFLNSITTTSENAIITTAGGLSEAFGSIAVSMDAGGGSRKGGGDKRGTVAPW